MTRRKSLQLFLVSAIAQIPFMKEILAAGKVVLGLDAAKSGGTPDPRAAGPKFYSDLKNAPAALVDSKKAVAKGKSTICKTCVLYVAKDGKKDHGLCPPFFQQDWVADQGFCQTWSPKA